VTPLLFAAEIVLHAVAHLLRRFVRECDGENLVRIDVADGEQVSDAVRQDARLTTAWPGHDEDRPFGCRDSLALLRVEARENRLFDGHTLHKIPCALRARTLVPVFVHP
jgi:hypothetical protein